MIDGIITLLIVGLSIWVMIARTMGVRPWGSLTHWFYTGNKYPVTPILPYSLRIIIKNNKPNVPSELPTNIEIIGDTYLYPIIENIPISTDDTVPIIYDGTSWVYFDTNKGSWAVIGATGSGKGNFIMSLLLKLLFIPTIDIVVIDAKAGLDYADIEDRIQLFDGDNITRGLEYLDAIMNSRNKLLRQSKHKNIYSYNENNIHKLNHVVYVIDEGAELDNRQRAIAARLARMGRAAGLTMIFATQYPTVEAMPSQIASNLKNRVCFQVASPRYVPVALAREQGDLSHPRPDLFPHAGICVYKQIGGVEIVGRVPELTDDIQRQQLSLLNIDRPITPISKQDHGGKSYKQKPPLTDNEVQLLLALDDTEDTIAPTCKRCGTNDNLRGTRNGFLCRNCWGNQNNQK